MTYQVSWGMDNNFNTHGEKWFAWHPVKLKSGEWVWRKNVWRTRDDLLCPAPNGIIEYWKYE